MPRTKTQSEGRKRSGSKNKKERIVARGEVMLVVRMSKARKLNKGKGYSFPTCYAVLVKRLWENKEIEALHDQVLQLRAAMPKRK